MTRGHDGLLGHHLYDTLLVPKDVIVLLDCSSRTARRRVLEARIQLGKAKFEKVTLREFCQAFGFPLKRFANRLEEARKGKKSLKLL